MKFPEYPAEAFTDLNGNGFYDAGEPFVDANTNGIYDSGATLFNGYKDYTTLLDVMGDYIKYSAELAKYRGMRQASGDMAQARNIITSIQTDIRNGRWHDVVRYVKVNIVSTNHVGSPLAVSGQVTYSGSSFFRTRVTPCGQPSQRLNNILDTRDIAGEFITFPFRTYFQVDFSVPVFKVQDYQPESQNFALSGNYLRNLPPLNDGTQDPTDPLASSFNFNSFTEYSVAATGWALTVYASPNVNLDLIDDIEFVVAHRSASRKNDVCN